MERIKLKEHWREYTEEQTRDFLRAGAEGKAHPSRSTAVRLLDGMTSVLDVGCGTGAMFELLRERRPDLDYLGIDVTEQFIEEARRRFPAQAERFRCFPLFELESLPRRFDAVLCRHVLEHLPDYRPAVQLMYGRAKRKLILVFYLPPRPLWIRRKRDERFEKGFYTHTYDLGQFVNHLLNDLSPPPIEVRIHPRQGTSDPSFRWGHYENIVYEVIRAEGAATDSG
ncbi:MAG TPA: class I SAM-dependent methyltransferase [Nitrospiraceae bacterium]|jgi:SAM-dependent methyltransferase|nr:class I SAM-dependent methyltransferase [Nitrospiraceae bacterium]